MLFLGRLTAINHSYFEKLSSIVRVDASYVLVCFGSGRAGPRAWVEDFGPGSGLEFRPVATSNLQWKINKAKYITVHLR